MTDWDPEAITLKMQQGHELLARGDYGAAFASFTQAVQLAQALGEGDLELDAINHQAAAVNAQGQPARALAILLRAIRIPADSAKEVRLARLQSNAGELQRQLGDLVGARENLTAAQMAFDSSPGNERAGAVNLINTGLLFQDLGRPVEARAFLQRAQQVGADLEDGELEAVALNNLANSDLMLGDFVVARERFSAALRHVRALELVDYEPDNLDGLGQALVALGELEEAESVHLEALALARLRDNHISELDSLISLGHVRLQLEPAAAVRFFSEALALASSLEQYTRLAELHELLSRAAEAAGDPWTALHHARELQALPRRHID